MVNGWRDLDQTLRTLDAMQRRIETVFDDWAYLGSGRERARRRAPTWPVVNAFETKEAFVYRAEVPGLGEGDVSVLVEEDALVLRGERKSGVPQGYTVHLRERAPVAFTRRLPLPGPVDADAVTAVLKDGALTVTLPKAKESLPRQITVKSA
jgi:HSP20 family protein